MFFTYIFSDCFHQNIFKLSQGEYIAPEKIENTYSQCTLVAQVFVYGESLKSTLVGIVVPDQIVLEIWCRNNNVSGTFSEMCRNKVNLVGGIISGSAN